MPKSKRYARIAITLPEQDLAAADRMALAKDRSRSWIVAEAIRRYAAGEGQSPSTAAAPLATDDTSPETAARMARLYGRMSPAEKLSRVQQLTMATNKLAMTGMRHRHPGESEPELLLRLARIRLGEHVAEAVYGGKSRRGA